MNRKEQIGIVNNKDIRMLCLFLQNKIRIG
jgi:hypothetical protein